MTVDSQDVPMFDVADAPVVTPKRPRVPGKPAWNVLHRKDPVKCDDCMLVLALARGEAPAARFANYRRKATDGTDLLLCIAHAQARRDEDGLSALKVKKATR